MSNYMNMESYLKSLDGQIRRLNEVIDSLPEGSLSISRNGKYYIWRVKYSDGSRVYLPKDQEELAKKLALKKMYSIRLEETKKEANACRLYLKESPAYAESADFMLTHVNDEWKRLIGDSMKTIDERVYEWENSAYVKYDKYPERLIVPTMKKGEFVRSKIEATLAGCLYDLKIPYKYEKVTLIGNTKIAVDFTTLDVRTFQEVPIELFGMLDNADYRQNCKKKINLYVANDYIPGVNMLAFYESISKPLSPIYIRQVLEDYFFNYMPAGD